MKVIVLTPNYPRRGAMMNGHFIHKQVKALQGLGLNCHVLLTHNWFPPWGLHRLHVYWQTGYTQKKTYLDQYEGVPIYHVPVFIKMPSRFFSENAYQREADAIVSFIKRTDSLQNADWIYANFLTDCGYIGTLIKKKLKAKLAAIARGDDVHAWPERDPSLVKNIRAVVKNADLLLSNSERLARDLLGWLTKPVDQDVHCIYNGVDTNRFSPCKDPSKKNELQVRFGFPTGFKFLLCVATPVVLKGWLELLDAIKLLGPGFNGWKLVAITTPRTNPDALDLNECAKKRNMREHIIWVGGVDPMDMPDYYRAVDAFVLPSYNEGLSNAVLEALASGLPVITTDVGGHSEVIKNFVSGILIPPQNTGTLLEGLTKLIDSETLRDSMGRGARLAAEKVGNCSKNALRLKKLLSYAT